MFEHIQITQMKNKYINFNAILYNSNDNSIIVAKCNKRHYATWGMIIFGPFNNVNQEELKKVIGHTDNNTKNIFRWAKYKEFLQTWINGQASDKFDILFCRMNTVDEMRKFMSYYHYYEGSNSEIIDILAFMGIKK